jgi:hypothetical protein
MELFTQLFGHLLAFVYHCFDRIVIHGYLTGLSRPEHVVHFFREVIGAPVITKEILSERTNHYQSWVEAFARNHRIRIEWAEKASARRSLSSAGNAEWCKKMPMACILFSKAWKWGRPSASRCRNIPPRERYCSHADPVPAVL